eukprot:GHVT01013208.1.p1 GENE.GHVT01013208.1~~GHVT01013208.1.p1  ORF type:complete len:107 (-),score=3.91 GHVT01013208.1:147-467(-)
MWCVTERSNPPVCSELMEADTLAVTVHQSSALQRLPTCALLVQARKSSANSSSSKKQGHRQVVQVWLWRGRWQPPPTGAVSLPPTTVTAFAGATTWRDAIDPGLNE